MLYALTYANAHIHITYIQYITLCIIKSSTHITYYYTNYTYVHVLVCRRVHISEATRQCLTRPIEMEPNNNLKDEYLNKLGINTYFINPTTVEEPETEVTNNNKKSVSYSERRHTVHSIDGVSQ